MVNVFTDINPYGQLGGAYLSGSITISGSGNYFFNYYPIANSVANITMKNISGSITGSFVAGQTIYGQITAVTQSSGMAFCYWANNDEVLTPSVTTGSVTFTGLLDSYPGAVFAYSMRRLSSTYTGSIIRVRRSSDNTEQNIGYLANGSLDEAALTSFVGAGDGFVTTWYDQSGIGNNATQITATNQPKIINSGTIYKINGIPAITYDGTNDFMDITSAPVATRPYLFFVAKPLGPIGTRNGGLITLHGSSIGVNNHFGADSLDWYDSYFSTTRPQVRPLVNIQQYLGTMYQNGTNIITSLNTEAEITVAAAIDTSLTRYGIGSFLTGYFGSFPSYNQYQELILYPTDQTSNKTPIKANINSYYTVYP